MWDYLLITTTMALLLLSLLPALGGWSKQREPNRLRIDPTHDGNIEHFAKRFNTFINHELANINLGKSTTEPPENYHFINNEQHAYSTPDEFEQRQINRILIADSTTKLPDNFSFAREIFAKQSLVSGNNNTIKAALARKNLKIKPGSTILRWAHAREIRVGHSCNILGRLSARELISLSPGCTFHWIHAPMILFLEDNDSIDTELNNHITDTRKATQSQSTSYERKRWLKKGDITIPAFSHVCADIIVHGNLVIGTGAIIEGSIKTHGDLLLESETQVKGAITSNGNIEIKEECQINAPVIAEGVIAINSGSVIGQRDKPTTITANIIQVANGAIVHGTLRAKTLGQAMQRAQ